MLVAVMVIGYAAFSTTLTINGTANISSTWNVVFTEIKQLTKSGGVTEKSLPQANRTTATLDVDLIVLRGNGTQDNAYIISTN